MTKSCYIILMIIMLAFNALAIGYTENKGQIYDQNGTLNPNVFFLLSSKDLNCQIRKSGFSYDLYKYERDSTVSISRVDFNFENCNPELKVIGQLPAPDFLNFYTAHTPKDGIKNVQVYDEVFMQGVWPDIDVKFTISDDKPKYDFILHPGAKLSDIKIRINGVEHISNERNGLKIQTGEFSLLESLPMSYVIDNDKRSTITAYFIENQDGTFGLSANLPFPNSYTTVIDPLPKIDWYTYYGGGGYDCATSVTTDKNGSVLIAGITNSMTNIATSGTFQSSIVEPEGIDIYIAKFDKNGTRIWGTYYGGQNDDYVTKIITDIDGKSPIIVGYSYSYIRFGTENTQQPEKSLKSDMIISKFNENGYKVWGTYYGGVEEEQANNVVVDNSGNIYVSGITTGSNGLANSSPFKSTFSGDVNGLIVKFSSNGIKLWSTYYGEDNFTVVGVSGISNNQLFITGSTTSKYGIASPGARIDSLSGQTDILLAAFDLQGHRLWGSYLGGNSDDVVYSSSLSNDGNWLIAGRTYSDTGIAFGRTFDKSVSSQDAFICKLKLSGEPIWGTYFGGEREESANQIVDDTLGDIFIIGTTNSHTNLASPGVIRSTKSSWTDEVYLAKFSNYGIRLWATYYGDNGNSWGIACDRKSNNVYACGEASETGLATTGSHQDFIAGGGSDGFIVKIGSCGPEIAHASNDGPAVSGGSISIFSSSGFQYVWDGPNDFLKEIQNPILNNCSFKDTGIYRLAVVDQFGCAAYDTTTVRIIDFPSSVEAKQDYTWRVYPNPVQNIINVDNCSGGMIYINDVMGRNLSKHQLQADHEVIDISRLSPGSYTIQVVDKNKIIKTNKFVKS